MSNCLNCSHIGKHPFCSFGPDAQAFLETNSVSMEYSRGNVLFREGNPGDAVYVLCSGRVKVSATSTEGRTAILRIASAGDVLGMAAALGNVDYEATAEALEPCRIRVLRTRTLAQFLGQFREASMAVSHALARDYRSAFKEIRRIALPESPAGRVARLLLDWSDDGRVVPATTITMQLTHEELASMTATTRETVTRTLSRFRKDKLIATKGVSFTILQPKALRDLCAC